MLDDKFITKEGFLEPAEYQEKTSYKFVARHYFRLRLLQSEILQVLQHRQAQQARTLGANQGNEFMHTKLPSPFLVKFDSFRSWRVDIDRRLLEWKDSAPTQLDAGVQFSPLFLELNYWQAVIMLYRQSLVVPTGLASELGGADGNVGSPSVVNIDEREDEEVVFLKVAEAGQKVLKLYRQLHRVHLVRRRPMSNLEKMTTADNLVVRTPSSLICAMSIVLMVLLTLYAVQNKLHVPRYSPPVYGW
jgi:hypothetical protein